MDSKTWAVEILTATDTQLVLYDNEIRFRIHRDMIKLDHPTKKRPVSATIQHLSCLLEMLDTTNYEIEVRRTFTRSES